MGATHNTSVSSNCRAYVPGWTTRDSSILTVLAMDAAIHLFDSNNRRQLNESSSPTPDAKQNKLNAEKFHAQHWQINFHDLEN